MTPIPIQIAGLGRTYGERRALDDVTFDVPAGAVVGLLGPNGSGKTTLFRILATLLRPTQGAARIFGHDVVAEARAARRLFGVVFQSPSLDKKLTAAENLTYHGRMYGLGGTELRQRVAELLDRARLGDRANEFVGRYSGGMARRVEIAKGLLHRPKLLLLDEPSTGLDPGARRDMWDQLGERRGSEDVTVFFTTHLMEEADRADMLVILDNGRVVARGAPAELRSHVGGDVIRIDTPNPDSLRDELVARFGGSATVMDRTVRIERPRGHEFVPQVVEAFPGRVSAISVGKPTLEDVFIRYTGHRLHVEDGQV